MWTTDVCVHVPCWLQHDAGTILIQACIRAETERNKARSRVNAWRNSGIEVVQGTLNSRVSPLYEAHVVGSVSGTATHHERAQRSTLIYSFMYILVLDRSVSCGTCSGCTCEVVLAGRCLEA